MASNKIVNVSGSETYFVSTSGSAVTNSTQPDVDNAAAIKVGASTTVVGVEHADGFESVNSGIVTVGVYHVIGLDVDQADGVSFASRDLITGYIDGVEAAIRAGYWNPVTGSFTTSPTGLSEVLVLNKQTLGWNNYLGGQLITGEDL